jgi:methanogenic corrinoid protein MtbC1
VRITSLADAAATLEPQLVVVSATSAQRLARVRDELGALARSMPLALAGVGATAALADSVGADRLTEDPVTEADRVARSLVRAPLGGSFEWRAAAGT